MFSNIEEEYLDLVDDNDNVIGCKKRTEIYEQHLSNYRVINAFVINSKGALLIPRRTNQKLYYPLALDFSIGGHVNSGENYADALKREAREELNIEVNQLHFRCLGYLNPKKDHVSSFMKVYEIKTDLLPEYNPDDFIEYFFLTPKDLRERINSGEQAKTDLLKILLLFYTT